MEPLDTKHDCGSFLMHKQWASPTRPPLHVIVQRHQHTVERPLKAIFVSLDHSVPTLKP